MENVALHLLDIVENALRAGASKVRVSIVEDRAADRRVVEVEDNGRGMDPRTAERALDPFFTTKEGKAFGLGLPLLAQAAREADGRLSLAAGERGGVRVTATFRMSHPDLKPLGDVDGTMAMLQSAHPDVEFVYRRTAAVAGEATR